MKDDQKRWFLKWSYTDCHGTQECNQNHTDGWSCPFDYGNRMSHWYCHCWPLVVTVIYIGLFYVIIRENLIALYLLVQTTIYGIFYCAITLVLIGALSIISLYYYILLFDQINKQVEWICNESKHRVSLAHQNSLIHLIKKHNSIAYLLYLIHFIIRTLVTFITLITLITLILVFFITLALMQIIPLNLYLKTDNVYMRIIYLIYLLTWLWIYNCLFSFSSNFSCSWTI